MIKLVKIEAFPNGAHDNLEVEEFTELEAGWAVIPDGTDTPNFPFGDVEASKVNGVMTMTKWTPGDIPEVIEEVPEDGNSDVWTELDAAYQEGVDSAYDS